MGRVYVGVMVDEEVNSKLVAEAERLRGSKAQVLRFLIESGVDRLPLEVKP